MMMCAQTMGSDRFVLERQGTRFELVLPAPAGHPAVVAAEELRLRSGAPPVTYVLATLDNRSGTGTVVLPSLEVRTATRDRAVRQGERAETLLIAEGRLGKPVRVTALARTGKLVTPGGPLDFRRVRDRP